MCYSGTKIFGCSYYYILTATYTAISDFINLYSTDLTCATCVDTTNWDFIKTASADLQVHSATANQRYGLCVAKNRFTYYTTTCDYYSTTAANLVTVNSLICAAQLSGNTAKGTINPFVLDQAALKGSCTDGKLSVTNGSVVACVSAGIIDNCKTYNTFTGYASTTTTMTGGCK